MPNIPNRPRYGLPTSAKQNGKSNNLRNSHSTWLVKSFSILLCLILLASCEDSDVRSAPYGIEISVKERVYSGSVMEDVVMRVSTPYQNIDRVETHLSQEILKSIEGFGESSIEFFVGDLVKGTYLVKVYSPTSELLQDIVTIE